MDKNSMIGFIIGYYILFNPIMMTQSYSLIMGLLNKANGKEVSIYENEDIEIIINYENIEKRIEEINLEMTELAQEKIKLENELEK